MQRKLFLVEREDLLMSKTYIVDGNSLLFRAYYSTAYTGNLMMNKDGIPTNAIFAFHNLMKKIKAKIKDGDHLFVAFDTDKPTFRRQEFSEYKAQRSECPEELKIQMPIAREMLLAMGIYYQELEGYEADDLAGSMAKYAALKGDEVRLFTSDKDFLQLLDLSDDVTVEMLKKGLTETICYTKANLKELFGLYPNQIVDFKGIAGDPSDNYKGIKGVGEKTAFKLLEQYGHLEEILKHCKEDPKPKVNQKFIEGEKEALFFKRLASIYTELEMKNSYDQSLYQPYQKSKLASFYLKYQLKQFLRQMDSLEGMIDDQNHQISLFDDEISETESQVSPFKQREEKIVSSFSEITEKIQAMTYDSSNDNENDATLYGFVFCSEHYIYSLTENNAKGDAGFIRFLKDQTKNLAVFDYKGLLVLLRRYGYPVIKGVDFDLLIATYIVNPDSGQKREDLFLSYGVSLDSSKNLASQTISYTLDLKQEVLAQLEQNESLSLFKNVEMKLSEILADMEMEGFPIDLSVLSEIDKEYKEILTSLQNQIYQLAGKEFNINSPKQLEEVLFTDLGIHHYKGEKGTSVEVLNAHINDHDIIPLILQYRLYNKLVSGYTSALPSHTKSDGKIHAIYNQALTSTGRLSMSEPNLQNISIRNEEGKNIRKAFFYPNKEYYILSLDYSQVELRMLAHIANIEVLKEIFQEKQDIHRATASKVFNVPFSEVTSEMRRKAKAVNFGIVYGISPYGLSNQLDIPVTEASQLISQFKSTFNGIEEFQQKTIQVAREKGYVTTILNRRRYLKDINSSNRALRSFSERAAVNSVIQGSAADLIKMAMIRCTEALKSYRTKMILQIHDELLFKVPKEEIDIVLPLLKKEMESALDISVPLEVDGNAAFTWYEAH